MNSQPIMYNPNIDNTDDVDYQYKKPQQRSRERPRPRSRREPEPEPEQDDYDYDYEPPRAKRRTYIDTLDNTKDKINWVLIGKTVAIYAIIFLIMSHIKTNEFIINLIPYLEDHEVYNMVFKGIILGIVIIITQKMLNI